MNLIIDFGNTFAKFYLFENEEIKAFFKLAYSDIFFSEMLSESKLNYTKINKKQLDFFLEANKINFNNAIISSVIDFPVDFASFLEEKIQNGIFLELNSETLVPIINMYQNKAQLGKDRLAVAVGANQLYNGKNILVIDAGSAITYEFISDKNQYLGGNISPGMQMRFKALNTFTNKLPLITILPESERLLSEKNEIGKNTHSAINLGVIKGIVLEMRGYIAQFEAQNSNTVVLLTGGDSFFFEKELKNSIFAHENLVAIGLNSILNYNLQALETQ